MLSMERMDAEAFAAYVERLVPAYARDLVESTGLPAPRSEAAARAHIAQFLPEGPATPGHEAYRFLTEAGEVVGNAWLALKPDDAFLCDIRIHAEMRGRGLGRRAMELLEAHARGAGCPQLRLHVFGGNRAAIALYEKLGFETISLQMRKRL